MHGYSLSAIPCMYPPTQPPAQTILTAKPFSRFHTNHWFSICSKVALCALDLLIFTKVPVQLRLYVSTEQRAMSHHFLWGSGQCPSILGMLELRAHLLSVLSDLRMLFLWQHNQTSEATAKCLPFQVLKYAFWDLVHRIWGWCKEAPL